MPHTLRSPLFALLALVAGCADAVGPSCTEIGCSDGVSLHLQDGAGIPLEDLAGTLSFDGRTVTFDCADPGANSDSVWCTGSYVWLDGVRPSTIDYIIEVDGQPLTGQAALTYEQVQPNGPDCPPVCDQASATITLTG